MASPARVGYAPGRFCSAYSALAKGSATPAAGGWRYRLGQEPVALTRRVCSDAELLRGPPMKNPPTNQVRNAHHSHTYDREDDYDGER